MTYNYVKYFSFQLQIPFTAIQYRLFIDRINIMIHYNIFDLKKKDTYTHDFVSSFSFSRTDGENMLKMSEAS